MPFSPSLLSIFHIFLLFWCFKKFRNRSFRIYFQRIIRDLSTIYCQQRPLSAFCRSIKPKIFLAPLCVGGGTLDSPPSRLPIHPWGRGLIPHQVPPPRWLTNSDATVFGVCCGFLPPVSQLEFLYQQPYVVSISENSPLRVCNVKRGDTILKWAENVVTNRDTFHRIYQQAKYDKAVTLVVCFCFLFFCFFPQRPMGLLVCV